MIICVIYSAYRGLYFQIVFKKLHFKQHSRFSYSFTIEHTLIRFKDLLETLNFLLVIKQVSFKSVSLAMNPVNPKIFYISCSPLFLNEMSVSFD